MSSFTAASAIPATARVASGPGRNLNMTQCVQVMKCPFGNFNELEEELDNLPELTAHSMPNVYVSKPSNLDVPEEWFDTIFGTSQNDPNGQMVPYSVSLANAINYGQGIIWGPGEAQYDVDNDFHKGTQKYKTVAQCRNAANRGNFDDALELMKAELRPLGLDPVEAHSHLLLTNLKKDESIPEDCPLLKLKLSQIAKDANASNYLYCKRCYNATTSTPLDEVVVHPIAKFQFKQLCVAGGQDGQDAERQARSGRIRGGVKLLEVYLHDMECCVPEGHQSNDLCTDKDSGCSLYTCHSPTAGIVGNTYDFILNHASNMVTAGQIPPGDVIDNGIPGYAFDDRRMITCLLYTSPSPRDQRGSRMPSSA